jgi:hypothetical protein
MRALIHRAGTFVVLTGVAAGGAGAQAAAIAHGPVRPSVLPSIEGSRVGISPPRASLGLVVLVPQGGAGKSPFAAGALSFIMPGVGSFYASHAGHGFRHLLIHAGSSMVVAVSALGCTAPCGGGCESDGGVVVPVAFAALMGNWAWGIVTAVQDAQAYNRRE